MDVFGLRTFKGQLGEGHWYVLGHKKTHMHTPEIL